MKDHVSIDALTPTLSRREREKSVLPKGEGMPIVIPEEAGIQVDLNVVPQLQFDGVRVEVILLLQIRLLIFSDVMVQ